MTESFGSLSRPEGMSGLTAWATDDLSAQAWVTLYEETTPLPPSTFWQIIRSFTVAMHWNRTIYSVTPINHETIDLQTQYVRHTGSGGGPGGPSPGERYHALRLLARKTPAPIGGDAEDGRAFDAKEWTAQWTHENKHFATFGLCIPETVVTEDNPRAMRYWPFQYSKVRCYRFVYEELPQEDDPVINGASEKDVTVRDGNTDDEHSSETADQPQTQCPPLGILKYEVVPLGEEVYAPRHFETLVRHAQPAAKKLVTVLRKRMAHIDLETGQSTYVKRVHHDRLVPEPAFRAWYDRLKLKYGYWARDWPECTDPVKFVHEEMAIAAYLCALWESERAAEGLEHLQKFVDCGCGNGFLVYLLMMEGHDGIGLDLQTRGIWDLYPAHVRAALRHETVDPTTFDVSSYDWVIGNHSDELSPWLPLMAARAQRDLNDGAIEDLPETADEPDPRFTTKRSRSSSQSISDEDEDDDEPPPQPRTARRASPRLFILPCCFFDFDGRKVSFGQTRRTLGVVAAAGTGKYEQYWRWIGDIMRATGFAVEVENLRIPSTKYVALIGRFMRRSERAAPQVIRELTHLVMHDAQMSRM